MVISAEKSDIVRYYAERDYGAEIFYVVQRKPAGLCDALFRAEAFVADDEQVLIGLPDTIWFPENAYRPAVDQCAEVNLVLFPVLNPAVFDAVVCDEQGFVERVQVKQPQPASHWIWGAVTVSGKAFKALKHLWNARHREDEYLGHLVNAYIAAGNQVRATYSGEHYMDVGTIEGYHSAQDFLRKAREPGLKVA
jgi:dTDP-glucose pyrophosphorylase